MSTNKTNKKEIQQEDSKYGPTAAFAVAVKELSLPDTFFESVPRDVRAWKTFECALWLEEVFTKENQFIDGYKNSFTKNSIDGVMLLAAGTNESLLSAYGFNDPVQLHKAKISIAQLISYQNKFEENRNFFKLEEDYVKMGGLSYQVRDTILETWTSLDVFAFLKRQTNLVMFLKPLALKNFTGKELNELLNDNFEKKFKELFVEGSVDKQDMKRFQLTFAALKKNLIAKEKKNLEIKKQMMHIELPPVDSFIDQQTIIGSGNFGEVHLANFKRRKVAQKTLKIKSSVKSDIKLEKNEGGKYVVNEKVKVKSKQTGELQTATVKDVVKKVEKNKSSTQYKVEIEVDGKKTIKDVAEADVFDKSTEQEQFDELKNDLLYEARMLFMCRGPGVLKLLAFDKDQPVLLTEYLFNKSVYEQLYLASQNNETSIFHSKNLSMSESRTNQQDLYFFQVIRIAKDVASALSRIHSLGVIHLDIAARNILLDRNLRPKICDFGLAVKLEDIIQHQSVIKLDDIDITSFDYSVTTNTGGEKSSNPNAVRRYSQYLNNGPCDRMPHWVFGETGRVDEKADIYAFGCFIYEMLTKGSPHPNMAAMDIKIRKNDGPFLPNLAVIDKRYVDVIQSCWMGYNEQSSLSSIEQSLITLHNNLMTTTTTCPPSYEQFKPSIQQLYNVPLSSVYSNSEEDSMKIEKNVSRNEKVVVVGDNDIRLRVRQFTDDSQAFLKANFVDSLDKQEFIQGLKYAYDMCDHLAIENYMLCVFIENIPRQVEVLCLCLDYLSKLSRDYHSSLLDDDAWFPMCESVLQIIEDARAAALSKVSEIAVLREATKVLSGLLNEKDVSGGYIENPLFESKLMTFISFAFTTHSKEDNILAANLAELVKVISSLSQSMSQKLIAEKAISMLLSLFDVHLKDDAVCINASVALAKFRIMDIISAGTLYDKIIGVVRKSFESTSSYRSNSDVVEKTLQALYQISENSLEYPDSMYIGKLFTNVSTNDIELLIRVLDTYPNVFRIQESVIGIIGCIISYSNEDIALPAPNEVVNVTSKDSSIEKTKLLVTTLLEADPELEHLLGAMERFKVDDNLSVGINKTEENLQLSGGVFSHNTSDLSRHMYGYKDNQKGSYASPYGYQNQNAYSNNESELKSKMKEAYNRGKMEKRLIFDEEGEFMTSASLQKNVCRVVGIACNLLPQVRIELQHSDFHKLIFSALNNHNKYIPLVFHGCHALFYICRGDEKHQEKLWELRFLTSLMDFLADYMRFDENNTNWLVVEAVMCTIIGWLEPSEEFLKEIASINADPKISDKKARIAEKKKTKRSFKIAEEVLRPPLTMLNVADRSGLNSLLQKFTLKTAEFHVRQECHALVCNFLKLVGSLKFWLPDEDCFQPNKQFIDLSDLQLFSRPALIQFCLDRAYRSGMGENVDSNTFGDDILTYAKEIFKTYSLIEFVLFLIAPHRGQSHTCGAGLSLITSSIWEAASVSMGDEISSYFIILYLRVSENVGKGIELFCTETKKMKSGDPILIRHSLWLLTIFLSEKEPSEGLTDTFRDIANYMIQKDDVSNKEKAYFELFMKGLCDIHEYGKLLSVRLAADSFVEWAIAVANAFDKYYTIQVLVVVFLTCMESHGHLSNKKKLAQVKEIVEKNMTRKADYFLSLKDEGHDTFLMGREQTFGSLSVHCGKLLRLLKMHLKTDQVEENLDQWDFYLRPKAIEISSIEPHTKPEPLYVLSIAWDNEKKNSWQAPLSLKEVTVLYNSLKVEFKDFPLPVFEPVKSKGFNLMQNRDPQYLESQKENIQQWLTKISNIPAILFCATFINALKKPSDLNFKIPSVKTETTKTLFPKITQADFDVSSMVYCDIDRILIVGTGTKRAGILGHFPGMDLKIRGTLAVYEMSVLGSEETNNEPMAHKVLRAGVVSVAWEEKRRIIVAGTARGIIIFFRLSNDKKVLEYVSELDYHHQAIFGLAFDSLFNSFAAVSSKGQITFYKMTEGTSSIQTATSDNISSVAYDSRESLMFIGCSKSQVKIYDTASKSFPFLCKIDLNEPSEKGGSEKNFNVSFLQFIEETRLLFVTCHCECQVFQIPLKSGLPKNIRLKFKISVLFPICDSLLLDRGKQVVLMTANGSMSVYDFSNKSKRIVDEDSSLKPVANSTKTITGAAIVEKNSSTVSNLMSWQDAIQGSVDVMQDWLIGKGQGSLQSSSRLELVRLIQKIAGVEDLEVAEVLNSHLTTNSVPDLLFHHALEEGFPTCSTFIEESQTIVVGHTSGRFTCYSLSDFFSSYNGIGKNLVVVKREMLLANPVVEAFVGKSFSDRGRKTILGNFSIGDERK